MENCLVTKLKGSVDNEHLEKFGVLRIKFDVPSTSTISTYFIAQGDNLKVKIVSGDAYLTNQIGTGNYGTEYTYGVNDLAWFKFNDSKGIVVVEVESKYEITFLEYFSTNMGNVEINFGNSKDISSLNYPSKLRVLRASFINSVSEIDEMTGDIDFFGNASNFGSLETLELSQKHLSGTLDALGNNPHINGIYINGTGSLRGTIEGFIANRVLAGSTNGQVEIRFPHLSFCSTNMSQTSTIVNWNGTSKISAVQGTVVLTKGYTQAEAEAAFPGKTIIRVDA